MRLALVFLLICSPALAELALPLPNGANETGRSLEVGRYKLPTGTFNADASPSMALQGEILTRAWRLPAGQTGTDIVAQSLREALIKLGFEPLFECNSAACGGFDFRFALSVLPPPQMEVDLNDFRFISAVSKTDANHHLTLLISRSDRGGHVQLTEVSPPTSEIIPLQLPEKATPSNSSLADQFKETGRAVLVDVAFGSGSTEMIAGSLDSLADVVEMMEDTPDLVVLIVGHSDNDGGLEANIELSRSRAQTVRNALISEYGIAPERLEAAGAAFLAPRALNDTEEGRALNRRVEIVKR